MNEESNQIDPITEEANEEKVEATPVEEAAAAEAGAEVEAEAKEEKEEVAE